VPEIFEKTVGQLGAAHRAYCRHWLELIDIEQRAAERLHSIKFTGGADACERDARALSGMRLTGVDEPIAEDAAPGGAVGGRMLHRFSKARGGLPFETKLACGDMVSISSMLSADGRARARWVLATGVIKAMDASEVAVLLQGRLPAVGPGQLLRIDKEEIMAAFGTCRNNVLALLTPQASDRARLSPRCLQQAGLSARTSYPPY
jgi:hypothetical protein